LYFPFSLRLILLLHSQFFTTFVVTLFSTRLLREPKQSQFSPPRSSSASVLHSVGTGTSRVRSRLGEPYSKLHNCMKRCILYKKPELPNLPPNPFASLIISFLFPSSIILPPTLISLSLSHPCGSSLSSLPFFFPFEC